MSYKSVFIREISTPSKPMLNTDIWILFAVLADILAHMSQTPISSEENMKTAEQKPRRLFIFIFLFFLVKKTTTSYSKVRPCASISLEKTAT